MAQGQSTRNVLSLRNPDDIPGALREIKRWGDRLPVGASGFHAFHSVDQTINAGVGTNLTFDTMVRNKEGWKTASATTYRVPPGLSGVYVLNAGAFWAPSLAGIFLSILVNGVAVTLNPFPAAATDRHFLSATFSLEDRDAVQFRFANTSGVNAVVTSFAGDNTTPPVPYLSAWRISLL